MLDSWFIDTNILLYATLTPRNEIDTRKKQLSRKLLLVQENTDENIRRDQTMAH